jgi:molybdopterin-containing oxidoreductase family iron-sulfur binding subunit
MQRGSVEMLLVLDVNAAYSAPADLDFAGQLSSVKLTVHWGLYDDETAALCHWHLPAAHDYESWSDAQAYDGTATIMQPLIAPLYGGKTIHEILSLLIDPVPRTSHDIVRDYWRRQWDKHRGGAAPPGLGPTNQFEEFWETSLHDGVVQGTALPAKEPTLAADLSEKLRRDTPARSPSAKDTFEIVFQPDPTIFDGRWANNGWLQECPKPLTKLTWDNAVLVSIDTAAALDLSVTPSGHGGEHGEVTVDMVELEYSGRSMTAAALILPGHPDNSATLTLGYGRTRAGQAGTGVGFNASRLRTSTAPWFGAGLKIRKTGETFKLACTEAHHLMENRGLICTATLDEFRSTPAFAQKEPEPKTADAHAHEPKQADLEAALPSLYPKGDHQYNGYKWGMSIDLTKCVGCNACVVACQAENNIPVVGKEQVTRGREMHWIRVDRYYRYRGDPGYGAKPEVHFQPIPCQQCENAPCEVVCPVAATVHSAEGLNDMVYNRCVGTRYCSNNCPYKVRRFNFLQFTDYTTPSLKLLNNPDVTVRSRGVMEKCTYCVQRITHARLDAEKQDRTIRDGELITACQAACPAEAIVFGDLNDPKSKVARCKALPTDYTILEDLNTRPRTTYLAGLRNPNPEIES